MILLTTAAWAYDPVWDVGGHVGTAFLPGAYPIAFPPKIADLDFDEDGVADDLDSDGVPDATTLERVRGDVRLGADAHYWLSGGHRLGVTGSAGFGAGFLDLFAILVYDRAFDLDRAYALVGGGAGFGYTRWVGADDDERLHLPSYPLRLEGGVMVPASDFVGFELKLVGQMAVPSRHAYTDRLGVERDVAGVPFPYTSLALELGFLWGQLR